MPEPAQGTAFDATRAAVARRLELPVEQVVAVADPDETVTAERGRSASRLDTSRVPGECLTPAVHVEVAAPEWRPAGNGCDRRADR